jgi:hypothetical protein
VEALKGTASSTSWTPCLLTREHANNATSAFDSQVPDEQQVAPWAKRRQPREYIPITFAHEPASQFHHTGRTELEQFVSGTAMRHSSRQSTPEQEPEGGGVPVEVGAVDVGAVPVPVVPLPRAAILDLTKVRA